VDVGKVTSNIKLIIGKKSLDSLLPKVLQFCMRFQLVFTTEIERKMLRGIFLLPASENCFDQQYHQVPRERLGFVTPGCLQSMELNVQLRNVKEISQLHRFAFEYGCPN